MDILTDILNTAGLRKRILNQKSLYQDWGLTFPCPKSIGFHVIIQGKAYLWKSKNSEPMLLNKGDIAFMSRGSQHYITTHSNIKLLDQKQNEEIKDNSNRDPILTIVSGAYQLWNDPIHALFNDLPSWKIINYNDINYLDSLQNCLKIISKELEANQLGSETIISSLLDVMFNLILRKIINNEENNVWSHAFKDPVISKVLKLMHSYPDKEWTVESLAQSAGLSRAGFALKFKQILSDTPLNYLTTLRIFKASDLLDKTDYNLEKIAHLVGYKDAFSFSKTFKRVTGISPKNFREINEKDKKLSYRF
ncbi:MAG: AraC family transcriptional regulator [Candidatus Sericytochromatia bacterium]